MEAMRAAYQPGLRPRTSPSRRRARATLRVLYAGICGTDIHEVHDGPLFVRSSAPSPDRVQAPILGHEALGEVVEVGEGARARRSRGGRAAQPCGRCAYSSGAYNLPDARPHGLACRGLRRVHRRQDAGSGSPPG